MRDPNEPNLQVGDEIPTVVERQLQQPELDAPYRTLERLMVRDMPERRRPIQLRRPARRNPRDDDGGGTVRPRPICPAVTRNLSQE